MQRLLKIPLFALNAFWAIPALLLMRVIRPWIHVRIGIINYGRIGHFVSDSALYFAMNELQSRDKHIIDLYWLPKSTCNETWARMVRRQLMVHWWVRYLIFYNNFLPLKTNHQLPSVYGSRDIHGFLQKSTARFEFTPEEEATAKAWLYKRGWKEGEPFVCLLVRDSAYLSQHSLYSNGDNNYWDYHDYRDSDIEAYVESVQILVDKGYWVIRMGKIMHKPLPFNHSRVVDYPFVEDQDDLIDIWLSARCFFFISTGSGIDLIASIYKRPVVFVNCNPLSNIHSYSNIVHISKNLIWRDTGHSLTISEHWHHAYTQTDLYDEAGIMIKDNSSTEIASAVLECEARLEGVWVESEDNMKRQTLFWKIMREMPGFYKYHNYINPESRVGCAWLQSMGDAFLE